jgi:TolB-like protein
MGTLEIVLLLLCGAGAAASVFTQWRSMQQADDATAAESRAGAAPSQAAMRTIAVLPFANGGDDPGLRAFAEGLASQIVGVMSVNDLQAIPNARREDFHGPGLRDAAARIGAALVLDGMVRLEAEVLRVNMHLTETRGGVTLWSNDYRRSRAESMELQEQVAAHVADVLRCALVWRRPEAGDIDSQTLAIFMRACDKVQRFDQGPEDMYEAARQVTERAPAFSRGWSMLAMASVLASRNVAPERAAQLQAEARAAAERARTLDPVNAESDLALSLLLPYSDWRGRAEFLQRALNNEPNSADVNLFQGLLLAETGRMKESLGFFRRAAALDPLSPSLPAAMMPVLIATGNNAEAQELRERNIRVWPDSPSIWSNNLNGAIFLRRTEVALAMLDAIDEAPVSMEQPLRSALRQYVEATRDGDREALRAAIEALVELVQQGRFETPRAITAAAVAGELDTAFRLAQAYFAAPGVDPASNAPVLTAHRFFLFTLPGAPMRRDPRFLELMQRIGLLAYWRETGKWPDYCDDPALPYDCRAESGQTASP